MPYDKILSIGHRCTPHIVIQQLFGKSETTPFSWVNTFNAKNVLNCFQNNFENFTENKYSLDYFRTVDKHHLSTEFSFHNYPIENEMLVESFKRKIKRLEQYLNSDMKILFIYANDDYIANENYRDITEENYNYLKELNDHITKKYPQLDFTIMNITAVPLENYGNIINKFIEYNRRLDIKHAVNFHLYNTVITQFRNKVITELRKFLIENGHEINEYKFLITEREKKLRQYNKSRKNRRIRV